MRSPRKWRGPPTSLTNLGQFYSLFPSPCINFTPLKLKAVLYRGALLSLFMFYSIRLGVFLRRYPIARVFILLYMVRIQSFLSPIFQNNLVVLTVTHTMMNDFDCRCCSTCGWWWFYWHINQKCTDQRPITNPCPQTNQSSDWSIYPLW